jgi:hypothetical protein
MRHPAPPRSSPSRRRPRFGAGAPHLHGWREVQDGIHSRRRKVEKRRPQFSRRRRAVRCLGPPGSGGGAAPTGAYPTSPPPARPPFPKPAATSRVSSCFSRPPPPSPCSSSSSWVHAGANCREADARGEALHCCRLCSFVRRGRLHTAGFCRCATASCWTNQSIRPARRSHHELRSSLISVA